MNSVRTLPFWEFTGTAKLGFVHAQTKFQNLAVSYTD
jgi:hypothetical protein